MLRAVFSLILNLMLLVLSSLGIFMSYMYSGIESFATISIFANILCVITELIYSISIIIYIAKSTKEPPRFVRDCKLVSLSCLIVMLLVITIPVLKKANTETFRTLFLDDTNIYLHLVSPALSLVSYLFFDPALNRRFSVNFVPPVAAFAYCLVIKIALEKGLLEAAPHSFFTFTEFSGFKTILIFLSAILSTFIVSLLLWLCSRLRKHN